MWLLDHLKLALIVAAVPCQLDSTALECTRTGLCLPHCNKTSFLYKGPVLGPQAGRHVQPRFYKTRTALALSHPHSLTVLTKCVKQRYWAPLLFFYHIGYRSRSTFNNISLRR